MRSIQVLIPFLAGVLLWAGEPPKNYLLAMDAIAAQNYAEAEKFLQMVVQDVETSREYQARAYNYLGDIALVNQSYQVAQRFYRKVLESYGDTTVYPRALYNMARMYSLVGDYDVGIALLSDYINRYAHDDLNEDGALYWLARAFAMKGEYFRAMGLYRELLTRFPNSVYAYHARQSLQNIEKNLKMTAREEDIAQIRADQKKYLQLVAKLLDLQNQLLDLKKQKIDELRMLLSKEKL